MNLGDWGEVAQIATTIVTAVGIVVSLWLSVKALREVEKDRALRHKPYLAFETGGLRLPIEFSRRGRAVPGVDDSYAEEALSHISTNAESVLIAWRPDDERYLPDPLYGHLRNYGLGPALSTSVTWKPEVVWIGQERFQIDEQKLSEPLYSAPLNTMPSDPQHVTPNGEAQLTRLPAFIVKDHEKKITQVNGQLMIHCSDIFGREHLAIQEFYLFTGYKDEQPWVHVTFGDLLADTVST